MASRIEPARVVRVNDVPSSPWGSICVALDVERWPRVTAGRAGVVAEVPRVHVPVAIRHGAANAPGRVGSVRHRTEVDRTVIDAEQHVTRMALSQRGDPGIVGSSDHRRVGIEGVDHGLPAVDDEVELAVAIELVAEQVAQHDGPRIEPPGELGQGSLVALEQCRVRAGREQRARYA